MSPEEPLSENLRLLGRWVDPRPSPKESLDEKVPKPTWDWVGVL
jgi:hypothetical protein